jgi:hypothetical protein
MSRPVLILMCFLRLVGSAQDTPKLQPPSPSPTKAAQNYKAQSERKQDVSQNQNGNAKSPTAAVNQNRTPPASEEQQNARVNNENDTAPERGMVGSSIVSAIATFFIAVLAWFQMRAAQKQAEYMANGLTLTRQAADAATESANIARGALHATTAQIEVVKISLKSCGLSPNI